MTQAKHYSKPRWRLTNQYWDGRLILVAIQGSAVWFRRKGTRTVYELPFKLGFQKAAQAVADQHRREKRAARGKRAVCVRRGSLC